VSHHSRIDSFLAIPEPHERKKMCSKAAYNEGDNEEEAEEDGDNDQRGDENEQRDEDDSDDEDGDEDDNEGDEEDYDDIDDDDYVGIMMMMKVMMIRSRGGSTMYHLHVAKELDKSLILIAYLSQTPMV
jgi:hypothetical protein